MGLASVDLYCFSGTGNTLLVAEKMVEVFEEKGVPARLLRLETAKAAEIDLGRTIGLAFPVAAQSTYPFVWDFLEAMASAPGTKVFMVDTLAGFSGGIVGPLGRMLRRKGYDTIGAREVIMPINWLPGSIDEEKDEAKRARGLEKAADYAAAIVEGTSRWGRMPILSDMMCAISRMNLTWKWLAKKGRRFVVDRDKCSQCGICVKLCPAANIEMREYPVFAGACQQCMRCVGMCPREAIGVPDKEYMIYRAVKAKSFFRLDEPAVGPPRHSQESSLEETSK